jgi:abnormal spindle-like microcephaly-associated protein
MREVRPPASTRAINTVRTTTQVCSPVLTGRSSTARGIKPAKQQARPLALKMRTVNSTREQKGKARTTAQNKPMNFSDDELMDKQERCFTKWLSHKLAPESVKQSSHALEAGAAGRGLAMGEIDGQLQRVRLQQQAHQLMSETTMRECILRLKHELDAGKIAPMRPDKSLHADVRIKQQCLKCVMSYNVDWLRLGLEAVYAETLPSSAESTLATFVKERMLSDADIADAYQQQTLHTEMNKFASMMFLSLVLFLDQAKSLRVIATDPPLFKTSGDIKSSAEMIKRFFHDVLSGGGDIMRQLRHIDYQVQHEQTPLAEYPFTVTNLSKDLKDGIRLCKLVEVLTNDQELMSHVKCPVNAKAVAKYNIKLAFDAFAKHGCKVSLCASEKDIMNGHQGRSLALLWQAMMHWQIMDMIDEKALCAEIDRIESWRRDSTGSRRSSVASNSGIVDTQMYMNSEKLRLLLEWCRVVCARYGVSVHNFTTSFSDGVVLCLLINFYHSDLLPLEEISCKRKKDDFEASAECEIVPTEGEQFINYFIPLTADDGDAKETQTKNFHVLQTRVLQLGGVPSIIAPRDMVNTTPDEKVVITYVTYLSSRLLDIRTQMEAASQIQSRWQSYRRKVLHPRYSVAALAIQKVARAHFHFESSATKTAAATIIQCMWRGFNVRQEVLPMLRAQLASVELLQATFRACLQRKLYLRQLASVRTLQAAVRARAARAAYKKSVSAVTRAQAMYRGAACRRSEAARRYALVTQSSAVLIQSSVRSYIARRQLQRTQTCQNLSATKIQSHVRRNLQVAAYTSMRDAAAIIQASVRCSQAQMEYVQQREGAIAIQAVMRGVVFRHQLQTMASAITQIQATYRGFTQRNEFIAVCAAVSTIQSAVRRRRLAQLNCALLQSTSATLIQSYVRRIVQVAVYTSMRNAAATIQASIRCSQAKTQYTAQKHAVISIQSVARRREACKALRAIKSIVRVQAIARGLYMRNRLQSMISASTKIQASYRGRTQRHKFIAMREAALQIQSAVRSNKYRRQQHSANCAAIDIQRVFRAYHVRHVITVQATAATHIQCWTRKVLANRVYRNTQERTVLLQALARGAIVRRQYTRLIESCTQLQACIRGCQARHAVAAAQEQMHCDTVREDAASTIQAAFRKLQSRREDNRAKTEARIGAALCVQRMVRGFRARREARNWMHTVVSLQVRPTV